MKIIQLEEWSTYTNTLQQETRKQDRHGALGPLAENVLDNSLKYGNFKEYIIKK